ncbi:MAG: hypothetical protein JWQ81_3561 [Amycolatopsis sp.]|jgi:hypothetical protein|nr:hypothetical protein [Amycolatopsis sp.]
MLVAEQALKRSHARGKRHTVNACGTGLRRTLWHSQPHPLPLLLRDAGLN